MSEKQPIIVTVPPARGVSMVSPEETNKDKKEQTPPNLADRINQRVEEAIEAKATAAAYGININEAVNKKTDEGQGLATSIVTNAMQTQEKAIERMQSDAKELKEEIKEANAAAARAEYSLLNEKLDRIQDAQKKSDESAKKAAEAGAPRSSFDVYYEVKGALDKMVSDMRANQPVQAAQPSTANELSVQIELKKLELEQQRVLGEISANAKASDREFELKIRQFSADENYRKLEYEDKKNFRQQGLQGLTDIIGAFGAGIGRDMGEPGQETVIEPQPGEGEEMGAYITSFPCSVCGEPVNVEPGSAIARCSDCGATFSIKPKE